MENIETGSEETVRVFGLSFLDYVNDPRNESVGDLAKATNEEVKNSLSS